MPSTIYIKGGNGDTLYLTGSGPSWNGATDAWQAQATSPFRTSMNDDTGGIWTPTAPPRIESYDGGPPFRIGAALRTRGYDNVTEQIGVQIKANTYDLRWRLLRVLRLTFTGGLTQIQPVLVVQPNGATYPVSYLILSATVQELPQGINQEATSGLLRLLVTWTLAPFGAGTTPDTFTSGTTVTNTGTGTPNNVLTYSGTGNGDMLYEGQPLNITVDATATPWAAASNRLMIAVIPSGGRTYTANTSSLATTSTTGVLAATINSIPATVLYTSPGVRGRVLARITTASTNLEVQAQVAAAGGEAFFSSPWVRAATTGSLNVLVDLGPILHPLYGLPYTGSPTLTVYIYARSTDGSTTGGSLGYVEWLSAYSVGETPIFIYDGAVTIETFAAQSGRPNTPIPPRVRTSRQFLPWRGRAPYHINNAGLYLLWRSGAASGNVHVTTEQAAITVTHAPLHETLRGGT